MKAIVELTNHEHDAMRKKRDALFAKTKGVRMDELFTHFKKTSGYAHYTFSGYVSDKLIDLLGRKPDSDEIIMLVDGGFSHFGATCTLNDRRFSGRVNID